MFNEPEWIKLLFLLSDTQQWLNNMQQQLMQQLPLQKSLRSHLSVTAMAHIIERHYYKIPRHPGTGKFHIPITDIISYTRQTQNLLPAPLKGSCNFYRSLQTETVLGFDKNGEPTKAITVITSPNGNIITAFPGNIE